MPEIEPPRLSVRVLLFDELHRVVLIRRTRPGQESYLTTPGGGVNPGETFEAAAARESAEEMGAVVKVGPVAFIAYNKEPTFGIQYFLLGRLRSIDVTRRTGHEFFEPERGSYETVHVNVDDPAALETLRPQDLRTILADHGAYLAQQAAAL